MKCGVIRRLSVLGVAAASLLAALPIRAQASDPLAGTLGRRRVLLVFAPSAQDVRFVRQKRAFAQNSPGAKDRDLTEVDVIGGAFPKIRGRYGVARSAFRVLLVGKDGHTAYSSSRPVSADDLFARIDRMPMRRDEMRQRRIAHPR